MRAQRAASLGSCTSPWLIHLSAPSCLSVLRKQPSRSAADGASARVPGPVSSTIDAAKLEVPIERNGLVRRDRLLARLQAAPGVRVIAVIGTAGSGKTTLLSQLARARDGEVAWVTVDDTDNDAKQLLRCVTASIARLGPAGSVDRRLSGVARRQPPSGCWRA